MADQSTFGEAEHLHSSAQDPVPWATGKLMLFHVLPGIAALPVFIFTLSLFAGTGVPTMAALFISILIAEAPVSWYLMVRAVRAEGKAVTAANLFPWRALQRTWKLVAIGLPLAIVGMILVFGVATTLEPVIISTLFSWVPDWMILEAGPAGMEGASRTGLMLVWLLSGVVGVGIGGVTQELYHRGFLLPRSGAMGALSVPFNALMFALVHLAAPWGWPFFFLGSLLWAAAVYRWKAVQFGLAGHVGMLLLGWLMMTAIVFGWIPVPG